MPLGVENAQTKCQILIYCLLNYSGFIVNWNVNVSSGTEKYIWLSSCMVILVNSSSVKCKTLILTIGLLNEYLPGLFLWNQNKASFKKYQNI